MTRFACGSCNLQIVSAGPCLSSGSAGTPNVGDIYSLKVVFNVTGTPSNPFRIKFTIANVTYYFSNISIGAGNGYWWLFDWWLNLDDTMPWSITLDPDGVSGNTNPVNSASGTFTPVPPSTAVNLYNSYSMCGLETSTLNFLAGSGMISNLWVLFGVPTTHGAQSVSSITGPANSTEIITNPYGVPVFQIARSNVAPATFQDTESFTVSTSSMRVNPTILRTVTWSQMENLSTQWTQWLAPDQVNESTNAAITEFVQQSLPANYQTTMTPYDTARMLHKAVMKKLTYQSPPLHGDAVGVLQDGVADCGGFAALLTSCLRNVGIPARRISGFWQGDGWQNGDDEWHVRVEFYLPGANWLVADPTVGNANDPTGTYAYDFGFAPDANIFMAMDVGDSHELPYNDFAFIQVPNWWWSGGATYTSGSGQAYFQPFPVVSHGAITSGTLPLSVTNVPSEGSIVLESSTNLVTWSPLVSVSATGEGLSYSFPTKNVPQAFIRARAVP